MPYNEITRVQVPALMHLAELGYNFISQKNKPNLDTATNILTDSFTQAFERLNPTKNAKDSLTEMKKRLNYDDLGKSFYEYLLKSENQIIDFDNPNNNLYEMVAELPYKSFRPDITLFINGLPLVNIEVKQPYAEKALKRKEIAISNAIKTLKTKFFITLRKSGSLAITCPMMKTSPIKASFIALLIRPFSNALLKPIS